MLKIEEGDYVFVTTKNQQFEGIVEYIPVATGDAWRIRTKNRLIYVQEYETIETKTSQEDQ